MYFLIFLMQFLLQQSFFLTIFNMLLDVRQFDFIGANPTHFQSFFHLHNLLPE